MKKKFIFTIFALCIAACAVTTVGCRQNNDSSNDSSNSGQLPALEFTQTTLEMVLGESNQLPSLSLEEGETVTYSSNNEKVATISAEGFVESKGVGSASIKATTSLGRTAFVQVVVYDPEFYPVYVHCDGGADREGRQILSGHQHLRSDPGLHRTARGG